MACPFDPREQAYNKSREADGKGPHMAVDLGRMLERMMAMDDETWARHANPCSGWSRLTTLPLLAMAIWARVWLGRWSLGPMAMIVLWIWLNPRLFLQPVSTANWMSCCVLGERIWMVPPQRRLRPIISAPRGR
jgi:uncharacterized protein DUF6653